MQIIPVLALFHLTLGNSFGQDSDTSLAARLTAYEHITGSASALGLVTKLDTNIGYFVTPNIWISAGLPVYLVRPSDSVASSTGARSGRGIGNVYGQLRYLLNHQSLSFSSTVTATAPTGKEELGFSTGRATIDWSNYLDRKFGRVTPFGELGFANAVSDTQFFIRPYTTKGFVTHAQAGSRFEIAPAVSVTGGAYVIRPSGDQTVWSRVAARQQNPASGSHVPAQAAAAAKGKTKPVFETDPVITGTADIARDHGFSGWLVVSPASYVDLYAGYVRSIPFSLNTVSFGMSVSIGKLFRQEGM